MELYIYHETHNAQSTFSRRKEATLHTRTVYQQKSLMVYLLAAIPRAVTSNIARELVAWSMVFGIEHNTKPRGNIEAQLPSAQNAYACTYLIKKNGSKQPRQQPQPKGASKTVQSPEETRLNLDLPS